MVKEIVWFCFAFLKAKMLKKYDSFSTNLMKCCEMSNALISVM